MNEFQVQDRFQVKIIKSYESRLSIEKVFLINIIYFNCISFQFNEFFCIFITLWFKWNSGYSYDEL